VADGLSAGLAGDWLGMLGAVPFSAPSATYLQLHTGPPGPSGSSNISSVTVRQLVAWGTVAGGQLTLGNTPQWSSWAGTSGEVVTDLSLWDAASSGDFLLSVQLAAAQTMVTGSTLQVTALTVALTPIAA
jgi:hypothetical protein